MATETQRSRDIARAALLRERIFGALRAATAPMSLTEICGMSGVVELYHKNMLPGRVHAQLRLLVRDGLVERIGRGQYAIKRAAEQLVPQQQDKPLQHLQLEVHKADKMVTFVFEGLQISVKVLP